MTDTMDQKIKNLKKQLEELQKNTIANFRPPSLTPPDIIRHGRADDDPKYLQLRNIVNEHWRLIVNVENAVGQLQLRISEPLIIDLSSKFLQAFQDAQQEIKHLKDDVNKLQNFKNNTHPLMKTHEVNFGVCHRNIQSVAQEIEKLKTNARALQATANKEAVFTSQKAMCPTSPQDLQNDCQVLEGSSSADKVVDEQPLGILLRTFEQRLETLEREHDGWKTRVVIGESSNDSSDSTLVELLNTPEEQHLEILGKQLLESLGNHLMSDVNQQLKSLEQQTSENLEQQEQRLLATMRQRLLELMEQRLSTAMEQRLLVAMEQRLLVAMEQRLLVAIEQRLSKMLEQRLSKILEHFPSKLPVKKVLTSSEQRQFSTLDQRLAKPIEHPPSIFLDTQVLKSLEQRCMESLKLHLTKTLKPQFEKLESHVKEAAHANRTLVKSRMSKLEGRMLPALHEKDEQVKELRSTQESMNRMLENLGERVEVLAERNEELETKNDELEHNMVGLRDAIDAIDIDSPETPPKPPPDVMGDEATSSDSEGGSNKRRRVGESTEQDDKPGELFSCRQRLL